MQGTRQETFALGGGGMEGNGPHKAVKVEAHTGEQRHLLTAAEAWGLAVPGCAREAEAERSRQHLQGHGPGNRDI